MPPAKAKASRARWNRRAAEVERETGVVEHDFDDVRVAQICGIAQRLTRRRDLRLLMRSKVLRHAPNQRRVDQRLIALHVDEDRAGRSAAARRLRRAGRFPMRWSLRVIATS